jgi:beta-galactosidase/beta-glucuronidase
MESVRHEEFAPAFTPRPPGMSAVLRYHLAALLCLIILSDSLHASDAPPAMRLSGMWNFRVDSLDAGVAGRWFAGFPGDSILLPGSMAERGKGENIGTNTRWTGHIVDSAWFTEPRFARYRQPGHVKVPFWLNPLKHYVGPAWYQRTLAIPSGWKGKRLVLILERCHWDTELWVDTVHVGVRNSLSTPHAYDLTPYLRQPSGRNLRGCERSQCNRSHPDQLERHCWSNGASGRSTRLDR